MNKEQTSMKFYKKNILEAILWSYIELSSLDIATLTAQTCVILGRTIALAL